MSAKIITANGNPGSPVGPDPAVVGPAVVKEYVTINEEWCGNCIQTDRLREGFINN
jgi:hypothetical protein